MLCTVTAGMSNSVSCQFSEQHKDNLTLLQHCLKQKVFKSNPDLHALCKCFKLKLSQNQNSSFDAITFSSQYASCTWFHKTEHSSFSWNQIWLKNYFLRLVDAFGIWMGYLVCNKIWKCAIVSCSLCWFVILRRSERCFAAYAFHRHCIPGWIL